MLNGINHLAFITGDMPATIRFWRDLLGFRLESGVGHDGYRHYFFRTANNQVAFFEYAGAKAMVKKDHGVKTGEPRGFDHVAFTVDGPEQLFELKDKLDAAGIEVSGPVDHGTIWSIYFFDPNNLPLEASWDCIELIEKPAFYEVQPLAVAEEGADPQPGHWPEPKRRTPRSEWKAKAGNGYVMRETFIKNGKGRMTPELEELLAAAEPTAGADG